MRLRNDGVLFYKLAVHAFARAAAVNIRMVEHVYTHIERDVYKPFDIFDWFVRNPHVAQTKSARAYSAYVRVFHAVIIAHGGVKCNSVFKIRAETKPQKISSRLRKEKQRKIKGRGARKMLHKPPNFLQPLDNRIKISHNIVKHNWRYYGRTHCTR